MTRSDYVENVEKSRGLLGDQFLILFFVSKAKVPLCKLLDCLVLESYIALTFMYSTYCSVFEIFFASFRMI